MGLFTKNVQCEICGKKTPKNDALAGMNDGLCCGHKCLAQWNALVSWEAPSTPLGAASAVQDNARLLLQAALQEMHPLDLLVSTKIPAPMEVVERHLAEYQRYVTEARPYLTGIGLEALAAILCDPDWTRLMGSTFGGRRAVRLSGGLFGQTKRLLMETIVYLGGEPAID